MSWLTRATAAALVAPAVYSLIEPHRVAVRYYQVALPNLPPAAEGLRIAQLSDLHCSAITSARFLRRAVDLCNSCRPDVVVLTGDFVSRRNSYSPFTLARRWARPIMEYAAAAAAVASHLEAPCGVFAVPGNHDHSLQRFDAIERLLQDAGITTLVNRHERLRGGLPIIGVDDLRAGRPRLEQAALGVASEEAQLILSHNPRLVWQVAVRNCLMLSGHTHAGQVHLPLTSFRYRPTDMRCSRWQEGWYRYGQAQLYVTSGVGSVHFPLRFRCPPEIAIFTLGRTSNSALTTNAGKVAKRL